MMNVQDDFAKQIKRVLTDYGVEKEPLRIDMVELFKLRALEAEGIEVVDAQEAMLAIQMKITLEDLARAAFPYATLSESLPEAATEGLGRAIYLP